jgi:hypothetical protein
VSGQVAPPSVSRAKFDQEVEAFRNLEASHRRLGRLLLKAEFPIVELLFVTPNAPQRMAPLAVRLDFTNFDVDPPSVRFFDVLTGRVLNIEEVAESMLRLPPDVDLAQVTLARQGKGPWPPVANMIQGYPGEPAFLCMPGTLEYHENPGHTGDLWLLHRSRGEGKLFHLASTISRYGTEPITGLEFQIQMSTQRREVPA